MLVILTLEPKGLILCIVLKGCLIWTSLILPFFHNRALETHCTWSAWCVLLDSFFLFLGRLHVISTGPTSTVQTEVRVSASS
ncbi:unnamed protein product [Staurois parvus]|uniref:Uncharacterized protein n=1 Tax=Staurois parvus TaxID=386267 RepID=A0ABN9AMD6_9NEOB|nr:unnamed protein product [Staurois parvus]